MERLLAGRMNVIDKIQSITSQPGISIGILHEGQVVFRHNTGVLDVTTGQNPDSDSLYCVASLSKAFMAASIDVLARKDKISWDAAVSSIGPELKHADKPHLYSDVTVRDICSHRTGLLGLDEIIQGLDGRILFSRQDVVRVCNALPVKHELRTRFLYNNALFELAGHLVECASGYTNWGDFQREHIFAPLGMARTTAYRSVHETDDNIATPYMVLTDGTLSRIAPTELSAESMNGGSGGVRSSVNDLLRWCQCLLHSFDEAIDTDRKVVRRVSPMFERSTIGDPQSAQDGDYCSGWCYHQTPGNLGLISPNRALVTPTLGSESRSLVVYGHQGDVPGYTCNLYLIPETESAVVVLSNGTGLSDATDWIAQDIIQTMHGLQPAVDFVEVAASAAQTYLSYYENNLWAPLERHRIPETLRPPLSQFAGSYTMDHLDGARLDVAPDPDDPEKLRMVVNEAPDQSWVLSHHHFDVFSRLPPSYDACLRRGLLATHWSSFLLRFTRGESDTVEGLCWTLNSVDVEFSRQCD